MNQELTPEQKAALEQAEKTLDAPRLLELNLALEAEQRRARAQDRMMGLDEDDPEDFKRAVRNMGPLTRKRFLKRIKNQTLTDEKIAEYIAQFDPEAEKVDA